MRIWQARWKARTDLLWLCHNILDFTLVDKEVHGPMIQSLQQFPLPSLDAMYQADKWDGKAWRYIPAGSPYKLLEGPRRRLLLFSRGYFKTTTNTVAHTVQALLCYPQLAMALLFSTDKKAQDILSEGIRNQFRYNQKLRELFPDYCPRTRISDWGNSESFTLDNRNFVLEKLSLPQRVEPSVMSQSIDKSQAGYHFDWIKGSDLVEANNCLTPQQRAQISYRVGLLPKLLVKRPDGLDGWIDVEGTFYHPEDLHMSMVNSWLEQTPEDRTWSVFIRGVFQRDYRLCAPDYKKYTPEDLALPWLLDENGRRVPTWATAESIDKLEREEKDPLEGGFVFAAQRTLDLKSDKSSMRPFTGSVRWKSKADMAKVPIVYRLTTVDLADTVSVKSNNSVITTAGVDRMGRVYVEEILRGKWGPDETLDKIFDVFTRKKPHKVVVEDYAYVHGLRPSIERKQAQKLCYPPWHFQTPDRTTKKIQRIVNTLQTPFANGDLWFLEDLVVDVEENRKLKLVVENEFHDCTLFSPGASDDVLDTLSYLFLARDWFGAEFGAEGAYLLDKAVVQKAIDDQYAKARKEMIWGPEVAQFTHQNGVDTRSGW